MKIAIEGCAHGELDKIYETIQYLEKIQKVKIDLLICCGDFQATRNSEDLSCMAVSQKWRQMCSFYKYYSGEKKAPVLTLFIGGNHEASNHLQELAYGGWAAPNIYYLGYAGVINIGGIRIGGISGIYKSRDYMRGHYEIVPYSEDSKRSVYHVRNLEIFRLKQLSQPVDIMLSHDWPQGVTDYGNKEKLLEIKPFFRQDIEDHNLGSKPAEELLHDLQPSYWFAAHLHCKFAAIIPHGPRKGDTKFLALDKCLPKRKFLQVMEFDQDEESPLELSYDLEWLTILHLTNHLLSVKKGICYMPGPSNHERWIFTPTEDEKTHVLNRFGGNLKIPLNFKQTVAAYNPDYRDYENPKPVARLNLQTTSFCDQLGIDDPLALLLEGSSLENTPNSKSVSYLLSPDHSGDLSQCLTEEEPSPLNSQNLNSSQRSNSVHSMFAKRLSMTLPPPKLATPDESSGEYFSLSVDSEITQEENKSQASQESVDNEGMCLNDSQTSNNSEDGRNEKRNISEVLRSVKRFKRRNLELYTNSENE